MASRPFASFRACVGIELEVRQEKEGGTAVNEGRVDAFADGGYIVVWESENQDGEFRGIFAQRFDADENKPYKQE